MEDGAWELSSSVESGAWKLSSSVEDGAWELSSSVKDGAWELSSSVEGVLQGRAPRQSVQGHKNKALRAVMMTEMICRCMRM